MWGPFILRTEMSDHSIERYSFSFPVNLFRLVLPFLTKESKIIICSGCVLDSGQSFGLSILCLAIPQNFAGWQFVASARPIYCRYSSAAHSTLSAVDLTLRRLNILCFAALQKGSLTGSSSLQQRGFAASFASSCRAALNPSRLDGFGISCQCCAPHSTRLPRHNTGFD